MGFINATNLIILLLFFQDSMSKPYSQQKSASEYLKELYEKQSQEKPLSQSEQNQLESSKQSSSSDH